MCLSAINTTLYSNLLRIAKNVYITFFSSRTIECVWQEGMKLVAEKLGFTWEEVECVFIEWQYQRLYLFHYGILRGG